MRPETRQNLADARSAAEEASRLAVGDWHVDRTLALAVERLLMIVGEALLRIRAMDPAVLEGLSDAHKVIGMRNVLVHGYDAVDPARMQDAIDRNVPKLLEEIASLLGD